MSNDPTVQEQIDGLEAQLAQEGADLAALQAQIDALKAAAAADTHAPPSDPPPAQPVDPSPAGDPPPVEPNGDPPAGDSPPVDDPPAGDPPSPPVRVPVDPSDPPADPPADPPPADDPPAEPELVHDEPLEDAAVAVCTRVGILRDDVLVRVQQARELVSPGALAAKVAVILLSEATQARTVDLMQLAAYGVLRQLEQNGGAQ